MAEPFLLGSYVRIAISIIEDRRLDNLGSEDSSASEERMSSQMLSSILGLLETSDWKNCDPAHNSSISIPSCKILSVTKRYEQPVWRDPESAERELTWRERASSLHNIYPFFEMLWRTSPQLLVATLALRICRAASPFLALWIPKMILDAVVIYISRGAGSKSKIIFLVAMELLVTIGNDIVGRFANLCDSLLADRFATRLSVNIIQHAATLDVAQFEDASFHDSLDRVRGQSSNRMALISSLLNLIQDVLSLAVLSVGLAVISPWLVLILACALVPTLLTESRHSSLMYSSLYRWTPYRRLLDYLRWLGASADSIKEVKLLKLGQYLSDAYLAVTHQIYQDSKRLAHMRAMIGSILSVGSTVAYYGAYIFVLVKTLSGRLSLGTFAFSAGSFARCRFHMDRIIGETVNISEQAVYLRDLFRFFETHPVVCSLPDAKAVPRQLRQGIEFRHVSFIYPGSDQLALRDISFSLAPGEVLALVGANGAGKTTMMKLLLRLYDPTDGEILLDGVDLKSYDLEEFHEMVGVLFQDYMRYDMLVSDNIGVGNINHIDDMEAIASAASKSGAAGFVEALPKQYGQMLGRRFAGGIALSGGEWQKLALARAHMRHSQLLILDEPTAALDPRAEDELFKAFKKLRGQRMMVLISHRFSTVRMADQILVMTKGAITERGKHGDLIRLGQQYSQLFELQASGYR